MQSFKESFEESRRIEKLLMDEGFADVMHAASKAADKVKSKIDKTLAGLAYERDETKKMLVTFFNALKDKLKGTDKVTDEMVQDAIMQLKQVGKFAVIAPLFAMPGGGTTTAIMYTLGKKFFNVSILPRGLEQVFESIEDMKMVKESVESI
jgi:CRISPR/Cas system-associated exonuclease Cas4 (RecB family)